MTTYTPAMQQYIDCKKQHQDCILFFRIGDFYETFFEDAKVTSKVLDLILTSKNKNADNPIPMAGIPHHSVDKYLQKLIQKGYKVAIAEQTTKPIPGQLVQREVVSIITPGTYIQNEDNTFKYILSISKQTQKDGQHFHIARGDFSMGEYYTKSFTSIQDMNSFIININPSEIIIDMNLDEKNDIQEQIKNQLQTVISIYDVPPDPIYYMNQTSHIQSIESFGKALEDGRLHATALLFHYLKNTQKTKLTNIHKIKLHSQENKILLDEITIKNLEIFNSSYEAKEKYSLIGIIDNCSSTGGSKLLRYSLANPLANLSQIQERLDHIAYYQQHKERSHSIHQLLKKTTDIPKILTTILYKKLLPSQFIKLRNTLDYFYNEDKQANNNLEELLRIGLSQEDKEQVAMIWDYLHQTLKTEIDNEEINFIKDGYNNHIDELRKTAFHSDKLLLDYQQKLITETWIQNIKIKFIRNQWYFIEITNKDIAQFESTLQDNIMRRNTLKWAQRYSSNYLNNIEQQITQAREKLTQYEREILEEIKQLISQRNKPLYQFAKTVAYLDLFTSQSLLATEKQFCKPKIHPEYDLKIQEGRHPVIENFLPKDEQFIANDLSMTSEQHTHIITWPNMWWKSTFLRQNAIIVLMAHAWLYVPAKSAKIPLVDGIFARVGSGDQIAKNQSTFMTEMIEVANIINNASPQSFVVFDELWRGTATYDGLALSKAILIYVAQKIACKTLIATHYHELIQLEWQIPWIKNYSVSVYETDHDVIFMKKIIEGWANKSYGIDVAKLAGITPEIIHKAEKYLKHLENTTTKTDTTIPTLINDTPHYQDNPQYNKIKSLLQSFDINHMTPIQALQLLSKLKEEIQWS